MRAVFLTIVLSFASVAMTAFAADSFVPLAPIPNLDTGRNATLGSYINSVFLFTISIAAMLAVLRIVLGGLKYMTTEAFQQKSQAREVIQKAVFGLLLLLGVYVLLSTINPQIVALDALKTSLSVVENGESVSGNRDRVRQSLAAGNELLNLRDQGYGEEIQDAARSAAGFKCTDPTNRACDLAFTVSDVTYGTNYVEITVQNLNQDENGDCGTVECGGFITKRVASDLVKKKLCEQSSTKEMPIPGCE